MSGYFIQYVACLPCIPEDDKARRLKTTQDPMVDESEQLKNSFDFSLLLQDFLENQLFQSFEYKVYFLNSNYD